MAKQIGKVYPPFIRKIVFPYFYLPPLLLSVVILGIISSHSKALFSQPLPNPDLANETFASVDTPINPQASGTGTVSGYASASSVPQGGSINFHISADVQAYDIQIFREGGNGRQLMLTIPNLPGALYTCGPVGVPPGQESVALGCNWPVAYTLQVPTNWPSGIYVADLLDADDKPGGYGSYIFFIVTEDQPGSTGDILFQSATNNWQAYNNYGGWGLYTSPRAVRVTFDRPFEPCTGCKYEWEIPMVRWLESEGYKVEYAASEDIHSNPAFLFNYKLLIIAGHDEYWTKETRDNIDAFINAGGNVAIFSGNTAYRQVRYEDGLRTLICYKSDYRQDPLYGVDNIRVSTEFSRTPVPNWPQNSTIGLGWTGWVNKTPGDGNVGQYTVYRSGHWVFAGTGLQDGDSFWYEPTETIEVDGAAFTWENGLPVVTGANQTPLNFTILGIQSSTDGYATMGIYSRPGGGTLFNAATMGWGRGLWPANNPEGYAIVRQITRNVIDTLSTGEPPPPPTYRVMATSFSHQPIAPLVNQAVVFSAVITPAYATPPITYTWQFGDDTPVTLTTVKTISHTYNTSGTYTVALTAANPYGQSAYSRTVTVAPTYPVTATSFTYQPVEPQQGEIVTFTAAVTPTYATPPITYTWQFGDSLSATIITTNVVTHTYPTTGTYTVILTAGNVYRQSSYTRAINVVPQSLPEPENLPVFLPIVIKKVEN